MHRMLFALFLLGVTATTGCYVGPAGGGYYHRPRTVVVIHHAHDFRR